MMSLKFILVSLFIAISISATQAESQPPKYGLRSAKYCETNDLDQKSKNHQKCGTIHLYENEKEGLSFWATFRPDNTPISNSENDKRMLFPQELSNYFAETDLGNKMVSKIFTEAWAQVYHKKFRPDDTPISIPEKVKRMLLPQRLSNYFADLGNKMVPKIFKKAWAQVNHKKKKDFYYDSMLIAKFDKKNGVLSLEMRNRPFEFLVIRNRVVIPHHWRYSMDRWNAEMQLQPNDIILTFSIETFYYKYSEIYKAVQKILLEQRLALPSSSEQVVRSLDKQNPIEETINIAQALGEEFRELAKNGNSRSMELLMFVHRVVLLPGSQTP